jgi:hypothetical protein
VVIGTDRCSAEGVEPLRTVDRLSRVEQRIRCNCGDADAETVGKQRQQAGFVPDVEREAGAQTRHELSLQALPIVPRLTIHDEDDFAGQSRIWARRRCVLPRQITDKLLVGIAILHLDEVWSLTAAPP